MSIIFYFFIFLFGLIIGSFLNCLIWRLPNKPPLTPFIKGEPLGGRKPPAPLYQEGILGGRSHCPKCKKQIAWYDNIPVLSFIMLGGKCRHCGRSISLQYPLVESITALLFVLAWQKELGIMNYELGFNLNFIIHNSLFIIQVLRDWFLISVMIVIFVIDLRWYLILDAVTLPAIAVVVILNLVLNPPSPLYQEGVYNAYQGGVLSWQNILISGIIGGSFFLIQFLVSRGRWIGGGDIRLGILMGVALGWPHILTAIILAYFIGSIVGITLILIGKKKWKSKVPLGTFLAASTIITLLWGEKILEWYLSMLAF